MRLKRWILPNPSLTIPITAAKTMLKFRLSHLYSLAKKSGPSIRSIVQSRWTSTLITAISLFFIWQAGRHLVTDFKILPNFFSMWFIAALFFALLYRLVNPFVWVLTLRAMDQQVDVFAASKIWIQSESRRWLPGGIWSYASRAIQAKTLKVSTGMASASMFLELLLTCVAAVLLVSIIFLFWTKEWVAVLNDAQFKLPALGFVVSTLAIASTLACLFYKTLASWGVGILGRFRILKNVSMSKAGTLKALAYSTLMALLNGTITLFLFWSILDANVPPAMVVVAATSIAWIIGLVTIFAPGGLVVREGAFAFCVLLWTPYATGIAVAVLARLVQMTAEAIALLIVGVDWQKHFSLRQLRAQ